MVCAPVIVDPTLVIRRREISGPVDTEGLSVRIRPLTKDIRGPFGILPISRTEPVTGDVEVADITRLYRLHLLIKYPELLSATGKTDRYIFTLCRNSIQSMVTAGDRRLGRPVKIGELHSGKRLHPVSERVNREHLPAPDQPFQ